MIGQVCRTNLSHWSKSRSGTERRSGAEARIAVGDSPGSGVGCSSEKVGASPVAGTQNSAVAPGAGVGVGCTRSCPSQAISNKQIEAKSVQIQQERLMAQL